MLTKLIVVIIPNIYIFEIICFIPKMNTILYVNYISIKKEENIFLASKITSTSPVNVGFYQSMNRSLRSTQKSQSEQR